MSLSLNFLSILARTLSSNRPIIPIWISLERSFPPAEVEYMMPMLVKSDDIRSGREAKARHGQLRVAQESVG